VGRLDANQYDQVANAAASAPTGANDETQGFALGDEWLDTVTQKIWKLVATPSPGNAVWKDSTASASGAHPVNVDTVDPTVGDDSGSGFAIGDHWINSATKDIFQAVSVAPGAAVWESLVTSDRLVLTNDHSLIFTNALEIVVSNG